MRKLNDLRRHLLDSPLPPALRPDQLLTFAERGQLISHAGMPGTQNRDYQLSYHGHLLVTDFAGDANALFFVVLRWYQQHQPGAAPDAVNWHADIIDTKKVDISLRLPLTESVTVTEEHGGTRLTPDQEPPIIDVFGAMFGAGGAGP
ncbi:MAG: hypothetical protein RLY86_129 [Pseudomonadota bacterium]|jgi:hypothetical protein